MTEKTNFTESVLQSPNNFNFDDYDNQSGKKYELLEEAIKNIKVPIPGKIYNAKYIKEDNNYYLLDGDFKDLIRIPKILNERKLFQYIEIGDNIDVQITNIIDNKEYTILGSVTSIFRREAFKMLENIEKDNFVHVTINELNPAGYNCTIHLNGCDIEAFLPQTLAGVNKIMDDEKQDLVGKELEMCVMSYVQEKGTWIVSRKAYLNQLAPMYIKQLDKNITYTGKVTGSAPFGVFVEFDNSLTGMIHKTNLNEDLRENFKSIKPGDSIEFKVKEVIDGKKIILTQIEKISLWDTIEIGQTMKGKVLSENSKGILVILDSDTLGVIKGDNIDNLQSGDKVRVKINEIDRDNRRIFLDKI